MIAKAAGFDTTPYPLHQEIRDLVCSIDPCDTREDEHIHDVLAWIDSGAPLFRTQKPATPPKHLVSYFVLLDEAARKILLVHHKNANLWLPTGGHVEPDEHPKDTVVRECIEELSVTPTFWRDTPLFITVTQTVGLTAGHTDVSLWYVVRGDSEKTYTFDEGEFHTIAWFSLNVIPFEKSDPHMARFVGKLESMLS